MIPYHKIKNIFKREERGKHKLLKGCFTDETVEFLKDTKWLWSEKVDGTNISIHWDGYNVNLYGRTENPKTTNGSIIALVFKGRN